VGRSVGNLLPEQRPNDDVIHIDVADPEVVDHKSRDDIPASSFLNEPVPNYRTLLWIGADFAA